MNLNLRTRTITNLFWKFAERSGAQLVQFIVSLILARLLLPEDYGLISLVLVLTQIMQVFVDSGLGNALIQKKDVDDTDFSSVFYFNLTLCILLYILIFLFSPFITSFYGSVELTGIIRVLSLTIIISGLKNVQQAYVSKTLQFKKFFFSTLGGTCVSAVIGISLAYLGFGYWALVFQKLFNQLVDTLILWITVKWRPKRVFSIKKLKDLISYGWKLLVSSLIDTLYTNLRQLLIGKMYSSADLAFYNQGNQFPNFVVSNINSSIDSVLLPIMSQEQDNTTTVKKMVRRSIKISTYIMAPLMIGLAACSSEIVEVFLTSKWLPCVPYLRIFCITYMFYPIHTANLNAIKSLGRSDIFLKLEILKKIVGVTILFSTIQFGVLVMAYSLLLSSFLSQLINSWPNKKLLNYGYVEQLIDILPSIAIALIMGACVLVVNVFEFPVAITLILKVIFGALLYILISVVFKIDSFFFLWDIVKAFFYKWKGQAR